MKKGRTSYRTVKFIAGLTEILRPKEYLTLSDWAAKYMVLPEGSSEAGKYRTDRAKYQKGIMDAITDPKTMDVAVMSSAQIGKTLMLTTGILYYIHYEPSTQMMVLPTLEDAEKFSKTKISKAIRDVKETRELVSEAKTRDSSNTILYKGYPGGELIMSGANSPRSLQGMSVRIVWMDEVDRYPDSAGAEGDPIGLAEKRSTSYWNRKRIKTSTPTITNKSKIQREYNYGSMEKWCTACPECGEFQPYSFKRLDFDTANMACEFCGCLSSEQAWKNSEHRWIAEHPERTKYRSFWLNEMASPFVDWEDIIEEFKKATERLKEHNDPELLKKFINTVLAETFDETDFADADKKLIDSEIQKRAETYDAEVPDPVILLTAAVDVQEERVEVEVRGWARDYESWGIYKTEIYGNLEKDDAWDELKAYLNRDFHFKNGQVINIAAFAIDTGGSHTQKTYKWAKSMRGKPMKCYPVKGYAGKPDMELFHKKSVVDIKDEIKGKKVVVDRTVLYILGVDAGKEMITNNLLLTEPGPGYFHFPDDESRGYDAKYYEGLTKERKVKTKKGGYITTKWVKASGARNEPFDLLNYNLAVIEILQPKYDELEAKLKEGRNYMIPSVRKNRKSVQGIEGWS